MMFAVAPAVAEIYTVKEALPPAGTFGLLLTVIKLEPEKLAVTPWPDGETETPFVTIPVKVLPDGEVSVTRAETLVAMPASTFVDDGETPTVNFLVAAGARYGRAKIAARTILVRKPRVRIFMV